MEHCRPEGFSTGLHQLCIDGLELFLLIGSPDKCLYCPDGGKPFLDYVIKPVHRLLKAAIHGSYLSDNAEKH